jgi:hypothetical protein
MVIIHQFRNRGLAHHDLWIRKDALGTIALVDSSIADIRSDSVSFRILGQ